jgi:hypothetical protein
MADALSQSQLAFSAGQASRMRTGGVLTAAVDEVSALFLQANKEREADRVSTVGWCEFVIWVGLGSEAKPQAVECCERLGRGGELRGRSLSHAVAKFLNACEGAISAVGTPRAIYGGMTPSDQQASLIRLLAECDQREAAAEDAAYQPCLTTAEREVAVVQWQFRRRCVEHLEDMLEASRPRCDRRQ